MLPVISANRATVSYGFGLFALSLSLSMNVAKADVVTFSGLSGGNGTPFTTYTEGRFTVTPITDDWFQAEVYGNPLPSIFDGPVGSPGLATIRITGSADFTWQSIDYSSNSGPSIYNIEGLLDGVPQFDETGTLKAQFAPFGFTTLGGVHSGTLIDTLDITVNPNIVGVPPPTSINLDNIVLSPVPEPGSLVLLGPVLLGLIRFRKWLQK